MVVVAAGLLAYQNSFTGAFVLDDFRSIPENPSIQHLWPVWQCLLPPRGRSLTVEARPLINLSLAISYALSGYKVWGYHALNLAIHILAGLTLLGIVRRTLLAPTLASRFGAAANELALATAVLWTVHPLQVESVTYVIQRAEAIMGLFYLLTLYCFIRGAESPHAEDGRWLMGNASRGLPSWAWYGLSVAACGLGMASKEVMVTAPVMVMLYDRAFVSGSFREAWRRRRPLYLALSATWVLLGFVLVPTSDIARALMTGQRPGLTWWQRLATLAAVPLENRGAEHFGFSWWQYLSAQPGVILYYLRLCIWPSPLCLNHPWPIVGTWISTLLPAVLVLILLGATVWAWRRNTAPLQAGPVWGFLGAWFFLILAPSSSVIPLPNALYEHRMYLSSAAVVSLVVVGCYSLMGRRSLIVFAVVAIGFGLLTWRRNRDYRSEVAIWSDGVAKFPNDSEMHYNLGVALARLGRMPEAVAQFEQALRIRPDSPWVDLDLANALSRLGRVPEAIGHYEQVVRAWPSHATAHNNLGVILAKTGRLPEAIEHFQQALKYEPDSVDAHNNLGAVLAQAGRLPEAIQQFEMVLRINPDDPEAHANLGIALEQAGRAPEAIEQYEQALRLRPNFTEVQSRLARLQVVR